MCSRMPDLQINPYLPFPAKIITRVQESDTVFTWQLQISDPELRESYVFQPGQFNMLYVSGIGEVPISIVDVDQNNLLLEHTIRIVGRVTGAMSELKTGASIGLRGPYGRGWPMPEARGKDVIVITGGLGCAPSVSIIKSIFAKREEFGFLTILQGVKHAEDLIWQEQYDAWKKEENTQVLLAADVGSPGWNGHTGLVTTLFDQIKSPAENSIVMMCGPEPMMIAAARTLADRGFNLDDIWLSMERNMKCALGHCGHCQYGHQFVCRDGPVFSYPEIAKLLAVRGF